MRRHVTAATVGLAICDWEKRKHLDAAGLRPVDEGRKMYSNDGQSASPVSRPLLARLWNQPHPEVHPVYRVQAAHDPTDKEAEKLVWTKFSQAIIYRHTKSMPKKRQQ